MVYAHPAEVMACQEAREKAERECQRLREIITQQADNISHLQRRAAELHNQVTALRGEFSCKR